MLYDFLTHVHRGGDYAYLHTLPARRSHWYRVDQMPSIYPECCRTNLYFNVHPLAQIPPCNAFGEVRQPQYVRGHIADVAAINCLYAEFDAKDYGSKEAILAHLDRLPVPAPSVLIDSGGGVHSYWLLDAPYVITSEDKREAAKYIQGGWTQVVGADNVKDLARILRVPGSLNYKYDPPRPVQWLVCDLDRQYAMRTLTAHLPPRKAEPVRLIYRRPVNSIQDFNDTHQIGDVLERYGYTYIGRRKMLSPYSSTGTPGVTIDEESNRAFVHHTSDPLCDGYWKRPFSVVCAFDFGGNVKKAVRALREGWS
jgi:hypothetical protein